MPTDTLTPAHLVAGPRPDTPAPKFAAGDHVTIDGVNGTWRIDRIRGGWAGLTRLDQPTGRKKRAKTPRRQTPPCSCTD
ncbi:hypothetical protein [Rhodococcus daqingensis]|uniref:Uncharacterized protein n=1 Tax=Rhodococcus daqingensis TaxID=2479363 RepID=A0ABW2S469_9NOCA